MAVFCIQPNGTAEVNGTNYGSHIDASQFHQDVAPQATGLSGFFGKGFAENAEDIAGSVAPEAGLKADEARLKAGTTAVNYNSLKH